MKLIANRTSRNVPRKERDAFYSNELFKKLAESPADQAQRILDLLREKDLATDPIE